MPKTVLINNGFVPIESGHPIITKGNIYNDFIKNGDLAIEQVQWISKFKTYQCSLLFV